MLGLTRTPIVLTGTLIALTLVGANTVGAQAAGWSSTSYLRLSAATTTDYPAAIVAGSCTTANAKTAFKLDDVKSGKTKTGAASALAASWSQTTINEKFSNLLKESYALTIAAGPKDSKTIACGAIGGTPTGNVLAIAVRPVGSTKDAGVAWLRQDGNKSRVMVLFADDIVPQASQPANQKQAPANATTPTTFHASIDKGDCAKPAATAAFPLTSIHASAASASKPATGGNATGGNATATSSQGAVMMSTSTIATKLQDLLKNPYVVVIRPMQSASSSSSAVACGAIGGDMSGKVLPFALAAVGNSHDVAFAWLQENGNKTDVTLFFVPNLTAPKASA
jgi:hypothetical protein